MFLYLYDEFNRYKGLTFLVVWNSLKTKPSITIICFISKHKCHRSSRVNTKLRSLLLTLSSESGITGICEAPDVQ